MSLPVTLTPGTLPITCYPDNVQDLGDAIINAATATLAFSFGGVIYSSSEPAPEYRGNTGWFNLNDYELYYWNSTFSRWARKHRVPAAASERRIWVGTAASLDTYDGGEAGAVGAGTGPIWEIASEFDAKFPIGVGTLPISSTVLAVGNTGGEEKHSLTPEEMEHMHGVGTDGNTDDPFNMLHRNWNTGADTYTQRYNDMNPSSASGWQDGPAINSGTGGTTRPLADKTVTAHNNLPPYYACYFIKRTARIWVFA